MEGECLAVESLANRNDARRASFAELVNRQSRFVYRVAYSVCRNAFDAEDVVQELFLKLYRGSAWERMKDERAFLARAAWRMAVSRLPRRKPDVAERESTSPGLDPERERITDDRLARVHRLIDSLPEELRRPLTLSGIEEMTSREIAEVMDIPEGTVRTRIQRARQIVKNKLEGMERE